MLLFHRYTMILLLYLYSTVIRDAPIPAFYSYSTVLLQFYPYTTVQPLYQYHGYATIPQITQLPFAHIGLSTCL